MCVSKRYARIERRAWSRSRDSFDPFHVKKSATSPWAQIFPGCCENRLYQQNRPKAAVFRAVAKQALVICEQLPGQPSNRCAPDGAKVYVTAVGPNRPNLAKAAKVPIARLGSALGQDRHGSRRTRPRPDKQYPGEQGSRVLTTAHVHKP